MSQPNPKLPITEDGRVSPPASSSFGQGKVVTSNDLLGGARELLIDHDGSIYRLRLTRTGKLILHK